MNRSKRYSPKIRERAVRMVFEPQSEYESEWAAMCSISDKIGCTAMRPPDDHLMRSIVDDYLHSNPVSDYDQLVSVRGLYESDESVIRRPLLKS